jgi:hypothetical protein
MMRDPLYAHLMPFNMRWFSAISFRARSTIWAMSLQRAVGEGMFEDDEVRALATLSEPLTDVATLSRLVGQQVLQRSLNAFEMINEPAIAMTDQGMVLEANTSYLPVRRRISRTSQPPLLSGQQGEFRTSAASRPVPQRG